MSVQVFPSGPFETNAYILSCPKTNQAAIIDPAPDSASSLIRAIATSGLEPKMILLTHSHWDHIADVAKLKKQWNIPVLIHLNDALNLEKPGSDGLPCWIAIEGVKPDSFIQEGDQIQVGEIGLEVIDTPGHTPGGVCFYAPKEKLLFSGDTLFQGSIGNLSFATARPELMWGSLKKLSHLPKETLVFPGHGASTTIGKESWLPDAEKLFS